jgi:8-oxo-dGTP diphosphatase
MVDPKELTAFDTRRYPVRPHVGVGILLIRNKKLLLVKRKYDPDAGYWSIPGGHVELGEKTKKAAEREGVKLAGIIDKIMHDRDGKIIYHYILINYFVEQVDGRIDQPPIPDSDALEAKFVEFNELKDYKLTESLIELLKELKIGY